MLENDSNFSSECLTSLSFQDNEGLILLGLAGTTENQGRVYAGPSHTKPEPHTRGASLRRLRRYTKQDLLVSFNSCFFSVLLSLKYPVVSQISRLCLCSSWSFLSLFLCVLENWCKFVITVKCKIVNAGVLLLSPSSRYFWTLLDLKRDFPREI